MTRTKKQLKIEKRKEKLEILASRNLVYCKHHGYILNKEDIENHKCYNGNHGTKYCQYIKFCGIEK